MTISNFQASASTPGLTVAYPSGFDPDLPFDMVGVAAVGYADLDPDVTISEPCQDFVLEAQESVTPIGAALVKDGVFIMRSVETLGQPQFQFVAFVSTPLPALGPDRVLQIAGLLLQGDNIWSFESTVSDGSAPLQLPARGVARVGVTACGTTLSASSQTGFMRTGAALVSIDDVAFAVLDNCGRLRAAAVTDPSSPSLELRAASQVLDDLSASNQKALGEYSFEVRNLRNVARDLPISVRSNITTAGTSPQQGGTALDVVIA